MRLKRRIEDLEAFALALDETLKKLIASAGVVNLLNKEIENLREEKKQLLDRLMSRDWESYKIYQMNPTGEMEEKDIGMDEDVDNAGEIIEVRDED